MGTANLPNRAGPALKRQRDPGDATQILCYALAVKPLFFKANPSRTTVIVSRLPVLKTPNIQPYHRHLTYGQSPEDVVDGHPGLVVAVRPQVPVGVQRFHS
jgi:hypothetical protein